MAANKCIKTKPKRSSSLNIIHDPPKKPKKPPTDLDIIIALLNKAKITHFYNTDFDLLEFMSPNTSKSAGFYFDKKGKLIDVDGSY